MVISIDWVIVFDLVSVIGGLIMGATLAMPHHYSGRNDRRSDFY